MGQMGMDPSGIALSLASVAVPTVLAAVFYMLLAASPGGIQYGNGGQCKLLRKKTNSRTSNGCVHNNHTNGDLANAKPEEVTEVLHEIEEPADEVVQEVVEEVPRVIEA